MKDTGDNQGFITYDDEATWLVTYADLMTLLLVFFVLLFTLSSLEKEKYKTTVDAVREVLQESPEMEGVMELIGEPDAADRKIRLDEVTGLRNREQSMVKSLKSSLGKVPLAERPDIASKNGKITITVSGEALFSSGSAELNPSAFNHFARMIETFKAFPEYTINIKGHTDDIPIATPQFPSNWELSAIRATTVLKYLIAKGIRAGRLTATGYGDVLPLVPNTTAENRARNRRVEFVLEKKEKN